MQHTSSNIDPIPADRVFRRASSPTETVSLPPAVYGYPAGGQDILRGWGSSQGLVSGDFLMKYLLGIRTGIRKCGIRSIESLLGPGGCH